MENKEQGSKANRLGTKIDSSQTWLCLETVAQITKRRLRDVAVYDPQSKLCESIWESLLPPVYVYDGRLCFQFVCLFTGAGGTPVSGPRSFLQSLVQGPFWGRGYPSLWYQVPSRGEGLRRVYPWSISMGYPPAQDRIGVPPPLLHRTRTDVRRARYASCVHTGGLSCLSQSSMKCALQKLSRAV